MNIVIGRVRPIYKMNIFVNFSAFSTSVTASASLSASVTIEVNIDLATIRRYADSTLVYVANELVDADSTAMVTAAQYCVQNIATCKSQSNQCKN